MSDFLTDLKPRNLLYLDEPERHLTPRQFAVALIITLLSAAFWGFVTGSKIVALVVGTGQTLTIWRTPAAVERLSLRIGAALLWGAVCAAFMLVLKRIELSH